MKILLEKWFGVYCQSRRCVRVTKTRQFPQKLSEGKMKNFPPKPIHTYIRIFKFVLFVVNLCGHFHLFTKNTQMENFSLKHFWKTKINASPLPPTNHTTNSRTYFILSHLSSAIRLYLYPKPSTLHTHSHTQSYNKNIFTGMRKSFKLHWIKFNSSILA